jgi:hypothetical protein
MRHITNLLVAALPMLPAIARVFSLAVFAHGGRAQASPNSGWRLTFEIVGVGIIALTGTGAAFSVAPTRLAKPERKNR